MSDQAAAAAADVKDGAVAAGAAVASGAAVAAGAVADGVSAAAPVVGEAAGKAADAVVVVGAAAAGAAESAVHAAKEAAPQVVAVAGVAAAGAVDTAKRAAGGVKLAFGVLSAAAVPATAAVIPVLAAAGGLAKGLFDLLKFEIFRDFFQVISLFFTGLKEQFKGTSFDEFYGNVSGLFAICWSCWLNDNAVALTHALFVIKFWITMTTSFYFLNKFRTYAPNAVASGLEMKTWAQRTTTDKMVAKYSALILTSMYLPVARDIIQVFTCDTEFVPQFQPDSKCTDGIMGLYIVMAVIELLGFILPIPICMFRIVQTNKPRVSLYDAEGKLRQGDKAYTDDDYRRDLEKDISPYKTLYDGYERKWSYYKVITMVIKMLLIVPTSVLVTTNKLGDRTTNDDTTLALKGEDDRRSNLLRVQSVLTLVILGIYAVLAWLSAPFLDPYDDFMDAVSRGCTLLIAFIGLLTSYVAYSSTANLAYGIVLNILSSVSGVAMLIVFVATFEPIQRKWKNWTMRIDFTKSRIDMETPVVFSKELELSRERKLRVWHEFWDVIFTQDVDLRIPKDIEASKDEGPMCKCLDKDWVHNPNKYVAQTLGFSGGKVPPYLLNFQGTVQERHEENKRIAAMESFSSYERALMLTSTMQGPDAAALQADIRTCIASLVGVDVWWDGSVEGKPIGETGKQRKRALANNSSATKFGKMYVIPFPFTAVWVADESDEEVTLSFSPIVNGIERDGNAGIKEFNHFMRANFAPEVIRRKNVRVALRALSGAMIYFFYQCRKQKAKQRTRTVSDGRGGSRTVVETYYVTVLFTFRNGMFNVAQGQDAVWEHPSGGLKLNMSKGFTCTVHYNDGEGWDHEGKHWTNEPETIGHGPLGIQSDYAMTEGLRKVMGLYGGDYAKNAFPIRDHTPTVLRNFQVYRDYYFGEFQRKENTLTYAFWFYVYNNDSIDPQQLSHIMTNCERNPLVQQFPSKYATELQMVQQKLAYYNSHPAVAYWYVFWHDVYCHNKSMDMFKGKADLFDPYKADALCYKPMQRADLVALLEKEGLRVAPSCGGRKRGGFNDQLLDKLYTRMDEYGKEKDEKDAKDAADKAAAAQLLAAQAIEQNYAGAAGVFASRDRVQSVVFDPLSGQAVVMQGNERVEVKADPTINIPAPVILAVAPVVLTDEKGNPLPTGPGGSTDPVATGSPQNMIVQPPPGAAPQQPMQFVPA